MAREIERRFLVRDPSVLAGRKGERIVQGYLVKQPGEMSTRVRIRDELAFLTLKSPRKGISRDEFEYEIPLADAQRILEDHCAGRVVEKTRYLIEEDGLTFEVDVFEGRLSGLFVAEVELSDEDAQLSLPPWIGEEISHDKRSGNSSLAQIGLHELPPAWVLRSAAHRNQQVPA